MSKLPHDEIKMRPILGMPSAELELQLLREALNAKRKCQKSVTSLGGVSAGSSSNSTLETGASGRSQNGSTDVVAIVEARARLRPAP